MAQLFADESSWTERMIHQSKQQQHSLFAMCYSPDGQWLVAATDTGVLSLFNLSICMQTFRTIGTTKQRPALAFPAVSESPIYSLTFAGTDNKPILMVGTDEEIVGYDWHYVMEQIPRWKDDSTRLNLEHVIRFQNPQKTGRRGRTTGVAETNALRCDMATASNIVYSAAGDGVCYQWDITTQQCIGSLVGHRGYLHDMVLLPSSKTIATASEDGTVRMWDAQNSTCTSTSMPLGEGSVVRSLLIDSGENWLVCGGSSSENAGRLALLCGGVRAGVAEAPAPIHSLCECDGLIVSVGAEGFLRNWSRDLSRVITTVSTASSLMYDVGYNQKNESSARVLASGGASPTIDLFIPNDDVCTPCGFVLEVAGQYNGLVR